MKRQEATRNDMRSLRISTSKLRKTNQEMMMVQEDLRKELEAIKVANKELKKQYDAEVVTAERTHRLEMKNLLNRNRELKNTVRALRKTAVTSRNGLEREHQQQQDVLMRQIQALHQELQSVKKSSEEQMRTQQRKHSVDVKFCMKEKRQLKKELVTSHNAQKKLEARIEVQEEEKRDLLTMYQTLRQELETMKELSEHHEQECEQYKRWLVEAHRHHLMEMQNLVIHLEEAKRLPNNVQLHDKCFALDQGLQKNCLKQYGFMKILGEGAFGKVMLATKKSAGGLGSSHQLLAIKSVPKDDVSDEQCDYRTFNEKQVFIHALRHPFLIQLHSCFQTKERLYYVMEYMPGGTMRQMLQTWKFSEDDARFYAAEISLATGFLHKCGVVHRDIKLENIMLDKDGHCKLVDFGLSAVGVFHEQKMFRDCGTEQYMAPEIHQNLGYGPEVDWWAVGVVMYVMLTYGFPYKVAGTSGCSDDIFNKELQYPEGLSSSAVSILKGLLTKDPAERLGTDGDLNAIKKHPFYETINWEELAQKRFKPRLTPQITEITEEEALNCNSIREEPVPSSLQTACANPLNEETYRRFSFVNVNYGTGQCETGVRSWGLSPLPHLFRMLRRGKR